MKLLPAIRGIVLAFLSLGLAALLNAHGLRKDASLAVEPTVTWRSPSPGPSYT
jgi:hypothetical protein